MAPPDDDAAQAPDYEARTGFDRWDLCRWIVMAGAAFAGDMLLVLPVVAGWELAGNDRPVLRLRGDVLEVRRGRAWFEHPVDTIVAFRRNRLGTYLMDVSVGNVNTSLALRLPGLARAERARCWRTLQIWHATRRREGVFD